MQHRILLVSLLLAALLAAGCSGSRTMTGEGDPASPQVAQEGSSAGESDWERAINPFPVYGEGGKRVDHPFLGGYNVPRPQFVDIDGDGDPDLFVQERSDQLIHFENTDPGSDSPLTWQSDNWRDLSIGEWYRFADMDQDGDYDLLAEQPYSYIRYYRNDGTSQQPDFTLVTDSLKDVDGTPIFSDRQNIPNVVDIDCDGRLDLFIGRLDGTVRRYESTGRDDRGVPQFELVSERFEGIEIVNQLMGTLHGANTLAFHDIDGDGDQDLFWGDFFEPGLLLIENRGSCGNPDLRTEPQPFPLSNPLETSGYNAPAFADWGGDGDVDLFVGVLGGAYNANTTLANNFHFYEQGDDGSFSLRSRRFLDMIDAGSESMAATGDLDGDGDGDLLMANRIDPGNRNSSIVVRYENRSGDGGPALHRADTLQLPEAYHYAPALGDLDGDGLDDLLLGTWRGRIAYYRNTGDGFEAVNESFVELRRGSNAAPVLGDLDGDGDLDLLVGESGGGVRYFRNEGSAGEPEFVLQPDAFPDVKADRRSAPELLDVDGDGDLDLIMGTESQGLLFYRNTGSAGSPAFSPEAMPFDVEAPALATPRFGDLDGDGRAEFLSGGAGGGLLYYRPSQ
ncbi:MAG: VCBS repeat-containing protein [Balneolaceae bacterium]|nr:VCBS repeat-containing protein [Balneolaceae bacterium]